LQPPDERLGFRLLSLRRAHHYYGGHSDRLPARITVAQDGYWNVTLDLGGGSASIRFLKAAWKSGR